MRVGIACLIAAYVLSQFYRAFLAVLTPVLKAELGATPEDLAAASGLWFLTFAAMQLPVGWSLDRLGPRRTAVTLLSLGGAGGAACFALAQTPLQIQLAMALIGIGCSPVLMASYYIFARQFAPAVFASLAGMTIGIGNLGNIAGSKPLAWAVEALGWREAVGAIGALTLVIALGLAVLVRDPERVTGGPRGSFLEILKMRQIWPILVMMLATYMPPASLRGLWVGPYYTDVFGADTGAIGNVTLVMGLAMVAGSFAYGPLDRLTGSRKWPNFIGNMICGFAFLGLWALPDTGGWTALALLAAIGFFGASFPQVTAHGRAFFPPHLVGRGVSLLNLFGIGSVGIAQLLTGQIHASIAPTPASAPYQALFLFFGLCLIVGSLVYLLSQDRTD